jgi:hypothetical protein
MLLNHPGGDIRNQGDFPRAQSESGPLSSCIRLYPEGQPSLRPPATGGLRPLLRRLRRMQKPQPLGEPQKKRDALSLLTLFERLTKPSRITVGPTLPDHLATLLFALERLGELKLGRGDHRSRNIVALRSFPWVPVERLNEQHAVPA